MTVRKVMDFDKLTSNEPDWRTTTTQVVARLQGGGEKRWSKKRASLMFAARDILHEEHPMTVRQVYYQLFSRGWLTNSQSSYRQVVGALVDARQYGILPWTHIEDRTRQPRTVTQYDDLSRFLERVKTSYRRDVWQRQPTYVEAWLEKDALSGIFQDQLRYYGITLNVGKGYDGWASIQEASQRLQAAQENGQDTAILYAGDYDPSGLHMEVSLRERLSYFNCKPEWQRLAITRDDIDTYDLPPEPGKRSDTRAEWMEDRYGELIQVELDALPLRVLRNRIIDTVEEVLDMQAFQETLDQQASEREQLASLIETHLD